jgi:hypothetical protein
MVQLDLTPKQVEELKNHYILELEKLQARSTEIMGILSKLVHGPITHLPGKQADPLQPADKAEEQTKQRGRPSGTPNLSDFIIQLLQEKNKPLTSGQIIKEYKKKNKIDLSGSTTTMASLNQALFRLRSKLNLITSTRRKGKKGNVYALVKKAEKPAGKVQPRKADKPVAQTQPKKAGKPGAKTQPKQVVKPVVKLQPKQADKPVAKTQPKQAEKLVKQEKEVPANTKSKWPQFVLDTLEKQKRVLSVNEFVKYAMVNLEIPAQDKKVTMKRIGPVLSHMVKTSKNIKSTRKAGQSARFYGLKDWFSDKNELIATYK